MTLITHTLFPTSSSWLPDLVTHRPLMSPWISKTVAVKVVTISTAIENSRSSLVPRSSGEADRRPG